MFPEACLRRHGYDREAITARARALDNPEVRNLAESRRSFPVTVAVGMFERRERSMRKMAFVLRAEALVGVSAFSPGSQLVGDSADVMLPDGNGFNGFNGKVVVFGTAHYDACMNQDGSVTYYSLLLRECHSPATRGRAARGIFGRGELRGQLLELGRVPVPESGPPGLRRAPGRLPPRPAAGRRGPTTP